MSKAIFNKKVLAAAIAGLMSVSLVVAEAVPVDRQEVPE